MDGQKQNYVVRPQETDPVAVLPGADVVGFSDRRTEVEHKDIAVIT